MRIAKLLLEAQHIEKRYGLRRLLDIPRLEIYDGDRIGLVGENGAGKSTLLGILSDTVSCDAGRIHRLTDIAFIRQMGAAEDTADSALQSAFHVRENRDYLSGGEQTRRRIAAALSRSDCLLFADEPTTDLDAQGIEILEKYLREYRGAILMVSHDRVLLDRVCNQIWHLEDGALTFFPGNYTDYLSERRQRRAHQRDEYEQYRAEQSRLRAAIQGKAERAEQVRLPARMGNSEARLHKRGTSASEARQHAQRKILETRLTMLEEKQRPRDDPEIRMALGARYPVTSKTALEINGLRLAFGDRILLSSASMRLPTGSKTALLGANGCGKTSLLRKIISGSSRIVVKPNVRIGWFDQNHLGTLRMDATALENSMADSSCGESLARTVLARLNMRGDDVFKRTETLSGGERAKVALTRLMLSDCNLLLLDEPTNHLDVFTMTALEDVLSMYAGTILFVSHDRAFTERLADRLILMEHQDLVPFEGGYAEYQRPKESHTDARLAISRLEIRMSALASEMDAPKKGTDPLKLREEYLDLAKQIRALKNTVE